MSKTNKQWIPKNIITQKKPRTGTKKMVAINLDPNTRDVIVMDSIEHDSSVNIELNDKVTNMYVGRVAGDNMAKVVKALQNHIIARRELYQNANIKITDDGLKEEIRVSLTKKKLASVLIERIMEGLK